MTTDSLIRRVGIWFLVAAVGVTYASVHWSPSVWIALGLFLGVGLVDLALVVMKQQTVSQKIHLTFPAWLDMTILVGLVVLFWVISGPAVFLPVLAGVVFGHLFWH